MFCYRCGSSMDDQSTTCPKCGTPVQMAAQPQPSTPLPATGVAQTGSPQTGAAQPTVRPQPVSPWLNVPPAPAYYTGSQETDTKAVLSLILGILAVFPLGLLAGIPAIVLGHISKSSIRHSMGRLKGEGMALAGLIMGYISLAVIPIVLIIAAIAIPSLMRARIAANESAAASRVRTVDTAQATYSVTYDQVGYASSLEALGPGSQEQCSQGNAEHACLIDSTLACTAAWCTKTGYKFHMSTTCSDGKCSEYVVTATPEIQGSTGQKSFCSTSDGIVRYHNGQQPVPLLSADECKEWTAL